MVKYYDMTSITNQVKDMTRLELDSIMNNNNFIYDTKDFEDKFSQFTGADYCIGLSSGTAALHLALKAIGIKPGDQVATVSHTFRATAAAIKYVGAEPVYVDIEQLSYCMDSFELENTLDNNPNIKAVIVVHLYGNSAMIDKIVNQRIEDGQLDECPLTLDELSRIKGTVDGNSGMLPVLRGIYHIRVEYPDEPKTAPLA